MNPLKVANQPSVPSAQPLRQVAVSHRTRTVCEIPTVRDRPRPSAPTVRTVRDRPPYRPCADPASVRDRCHFSVTRTVWTVALQPFRNPKLFYTSRAVT